MQTSIEEYVGTFSELAETAMTDDLSCCCDFRKQLTNQLQTKMKYYVKKDHLDLLIYTEPVTARVQPTHGNLAIQLVVSEASYPAKKGFKSYAGHVLAFLLKFNCCGINRPTIKFCHPLNRTNHKDESQRDGNKVSTVNVVDAPLYTNKSYILSHGKKYNVSK
jgi:hypothetical protein